MNVYQAILAVSADLAAMGISKDKRNTAQGYNFRGIDDCYAALAPLLVKHKLVILPRVLTHKETQFASKQGGTLFKAVVEVEFTFAYAGDRHAEIGGTAIHLGDLVNVTVRTIGEGMDSGDKATNKAMSAAYKYACFQTFCIPVEGVAADSEENGHEVYDRDNDSPADRAEPPGLPPDFSGLKISAEAAKLGLDWPRLHDLLFDVTGQDFISPTEAAKRLTSPQRNKILARLLQLQLDVRIGKVERDAASILDPNT